ncbi:tetratricopeptide repeat protein [Acidisoma sp. 7E03]
MVPLSYEGIASRLDAGDQPGLEAALAAHLREPPDPHWIDLGIFLRDRGQQRLALVVFDRLMRALPEWIAPYFEAAFLHRLAGEHALAAQLLRQAHAVDPRNMRVLLFLIHMTYATGEEEEADHLYHRGLLLAKEEDLAPLAEMRAFGLFLREWPKARALALMHRNQERYRHAAAGEVGEAALAAVEARRPFALIRLGDGEGSCINLGPEDEGRFAALHSRNRAELTAMWFGPQFDWNGRAFRSLVRQLPRTALDADFVGLPYEGWIDHEYRIASLRGIPTLINIHRAFAQFDEPKTQLRSCSQLVHVDLAQAGFMRQIIRAAGRVSIISCLPEVAEIIRSRLGIEDVTFYRIPGERGSVAALGDEIVAGSHFPEVFTHIMAQLEQPHDGRLFLVAGGVLGKFYAAKIKQHGGVALDIGSVIDGWAARATRPGLQTPL